MQESDRTPHVVIVGGGVAGLEALMALRDLAGDRVELTLVAPDPDFTYKPLAVEEPFSHQPPEQRALEPIAREFGGRFVQAAWIELLPRITRLSSPRASVCITRSCSCAPADGRSPPSATAPRSWLLEIHFGSTTC